MGFFDHVAELFAEAWLYNFTFDLGRYLVAAPIIFLLIHALCRPWFAGRRIQQRQASLADIRRELFISVVAALVFSTVGVAVFAGIQAGVIKAFSSESIDPLNIALGFVASVVGHDAYFYWTHRAMHQPRVFRLMHRAHHRSRTPTAFAAYAFGPLEAVVQSLYLPLFLLVVPLDSVTIFLFLTHMIVRNAIGHSGHEWFPRGMAGSRWFGWITAVTHHDLHHEAGRLNYGLYFTWWDRWMGTEHPDYRRRFDEATSRSNADNVIPAIVVPPVTVVSDTRV